LVFNVCYEEMLKGMVVFAALILEGFFSIDFLGLMYVRELATHARCILEWGSVKCSSELIMLSPVNKIDSSLPARDEKHWWFSFASRPKC
jgi:hypothetical protein